MDRLWLRGSHSDWIGGVWTVSGKEEAVPRDQSFSTRTGIDAEHQLAGVREDGGNHRHI